MNAATTGGDTRLPADGKQVPVLGPGVWQVPDAPEYAIFDFTLPADDMAEPDAFDRTGGTGRALESRLW